MDKGTQTMIENLQKNTGRTLPEWMELLDQQKLQKHGEMVKYLKAEHGLTHGFANLIALKTKGSDADSVAEQQVDLVEKQYKGKESLKEIYDALVEQVQQFGTDVELAPKNAYVSVRRKKQFAIFQPATKTRFEIGLNLKGKPADGKLQAVSAANAMCSHVIHLGSAGDVDAEVVTWLKQAYLGAG